jgi:hypothetical protein
MALRCVRLRARRRTRASLWAGTAAMLSLVLAAGPTVAVGSGSRADPFGADPNDDGYGSDWLMGVKALAPDDVWIVGNHPSSRSDMQPVMRHFDGTTWARVGHLDRLRYSHCLPTDVDATSDGDVWVSCHHFDSHPMVEHWDGVTWDLQELPGAGSEAHNHTLWDIWVDAPDDVWAVGRYQELPDAHINGLVEHFDGVRWTLISAPELDYSQFYGVSGTSPTDVWVVGETTVQGRERVARTVHYDGKRWSVVANPTPPDRSTLESVSLLGPDDAWAVGWYESGLALHALTLHWNGTVWDLVNADPVGPAFLFGVSAVSDDDVWAVGSTQGPDALPLAMHWDGQLWTPEPPRHPGSGISGDRLLSVSADRHNDVWAVGYWEGRSRWVRMYQHWDGTRWSRHTLR